MKGLGIPMRRTVKGSSFLSPCGSEERPFGLQHSDLTTGSPTKTKVHLSPPQRQSLSIKIRDTVKVP